MANSNGWGDGSVNNSIGWGQGANNEISWGKSHKNSWSGATDIDGLVDLVNTVAPAITGTTQEGQIVTCSTGTWTGTAPITYAYQWKRNGSNIGSATNSTYTLVTADVSQSITCQVTATNAVGSANAISNTITPTSAFDPDAQAFITAAAITDPTQQAAINTLVVDLKGYNIWTKFSAVYPFCGSTASQHKWNLKNPLDTNAAFRLFFNGGGTHSSNGYQTNGLNAFAETYYNPSVNLTSASSNHISLYSRTNNQGGIDMGGGVGSVLVDLELKYSTTSFNWNMAANFSHTNSNSQGHYINTRTASNAFKLLKNGTTVLGSSTGASGVTKPNITYHIGKRNYDPLWTNRQYCFASIGDGLTDTEAANFYTAVQTYQTTLGRQV